MDIPGLLKIEDVLRMDREFLRCKTKIRLLKLYALVKSKTILKTNKPFQI
jgi:hypothetical protein